MTKRDSETLVEILAELKRIRIATEEYANRKITVSLGSSNPECRPSTSSIPFTLRTPPPETTT